MLAQVLAPEVGAAAELTPYARGLPWIFERGCAAMNRFGWNGWKDAFFDRWAAAWIQPGMHFYGWLHQSLACIRQTHAHGGKTFVDRGSVEPRLQQRWLIEEYARFGLKSDPISHGAVQRMVTEAEETDIIVTPSRLVADSYVDAGYRECKVRVNPLGIDSLLYSPPVDPLQRDSIRFVFVGQISIQKGIPDLLEVWKKFESRPVELVLAGVIPPKERAVIEPMLERAEDVTWVGHCEDVPQLLRDCDVLLLPSAQDGFGSVVLEAMACGLPVIVSNRVGAKDWVRDDVNGFIFPYGDRQALEERMAWFVADRSRVESMRAQARSTAEQCSWESYGRRLVSMLQQGVSA